jgi:hypothetical protein
MSRNCIFLVVAAAAWTAAASIVPATDRGFAIVIGPATPTGHTGGGEPEDAARMAAYFKAAAIPSYSVAGKDATVKSILSAVETANALSASTAPGTANSGRSFEDLYIYYAGDSEDGAPNSLGEQHYLVTAEHVHSAGIGTNCITIGQLISAAGKSKAERGIFILDTVAPAEGEVGRLQALAMRQLRGRSLTMLFAAAPRTAAYVRSACGGVGGVFTCALLQELSGKEQPSPVTDLLRDVEARMKRLNANAANAGTPQKPFLAGVDWRQVPALPAYSGGKPAVSLR